MQLRHSFQACFKKSYTAMHDFVKVQLLIQSNALFKPFTVSLSEDLLTQNGVNKKSVNVVNNNSANANIVNSKLSTPTSESFEIRMLTDLLNKKCRSKTVRFIQNVRLCSCTLRSHNKLCGMSIYVFHRAVGQLNFPQIFRQRNRAKHHRRFMP